MPANSYAAVGTLVHDALHAHYGEAKMSWPKAMEWAVGEWEDHSKSTGSWDNVDYQWWAETKQMAQAMVGGYALHYGTAEQYLDDHNLEFLETERTFSFQVGDYQVEGIWDGIVRHKQTGKLWVFETKTTNNLDRMVKGIQWDYQPQLYVAAASKIYGEPIAGVIYNIVKRTDPFTVKILQNGMPSTAKAEREGTTPTAYRQLVEAGLAQLPEDKRADERLKYELLIGEMMTWPSPLYVRHAVTFTPDQVTNVLRYAELEGHAMVGTASLGEHAQPAYDRYNCGTCSYRWACQSMSDGGDWREILDNTMVRIQEEATYGTEAYSPDDE